MTRATIITPIDVASAASAVPAASTTSTATSTRFLPYMSPSRPAIGVTTEAESRYALRIQAAPVVVVFRSSWIVSSAGATSDCSSAYETAAAASRVKVTL